MLDFAISTLAFIIAISVLVAVHEYGHFCVARKLGFTVQRFSIGFGQPLLRWQGNDFGVPVSLAHGEGRSPWLAWLASERGREPVEFCISAIPLGGYVKMLDEREGPVEASDRSGAFNQRPAWARIAVLLAGPGFNFLFAILAYWLMFMSGVPGMRPYIEAVEPGSVVAQAGLEHGDVITTVGGRDTPTWEAAIVGILDATLGDGRIDLTATADNGNRKSVTLDVRGREGELTEPEALFAALGIEMGPRVQPVIGTIAEGLAAAQAGLREGDRVVAVDAVPVRFWDELVTKVRASPGATLVFDVERGDRRLELPVAVAIVTDSGEPYGQIGAGARPYPPELIDRVRVLERHGPIAALGAGISKTWEASALTVRMIGRMLTGDVSIKSASGPIMIAAYAGDYVQAGPLAFLSFLSLISISLGIMNLLPVPILDGGRIVEQLIELVKGSPLSEKSLIVGQQIGIAMLLVLTCIVFYNDIARLMN